MDLVNRLGRRADVTPAGSIADCPARKLGQPSVARRIDLAPRGGDTGAETGLVNGLWTRAASGIRAAGQPLLLVGCQKSAWPVSCGDGEISDRAS